MFLESLIALWENKFIESMNLTLGMSRLSILAPFTTETGLLYAACGVLLG